MVNPSLEDEHRYIESNVPPVAFLTDFLEKVGKANSHLWLVSGEEALDWNCQDEKR
jgi:hypothetical protein